LNAKIENPAIAPPTNSATELSQHIEISPAEDSIWTNAANLLSSSPPPDTSLLNLINEVPAAAALGAATLAGATAAAKTVINNANEINAAASAVVEVVNNFAGYSSLTELLKAKRDLIDSI